MKPEMLTKTKFHVCAFFVLLMLSTVATAQLRKLTIDAGKMQGTIRDLQGVNRRPLSIHAGSIHLTKHYCDLKSGCFVSG